MTVENETDAQVATLASGRAARFRLQAGVGIGRDRADSHKVAARLHVRAVCLKHRRDGGRVAPTNAQIAVPELCLN